MSNFVLFADNYLLYLASCLQTMALGIYERFKDENITCQDLKPFTGLPLGGWHFYKHSDKK